MVRSMIAQRHSSAIENTSTTLLLKKWIINKDLLAVQHGEFCSMLCGSLSRRKVLGRMDTHICMAVSLHCSLETITALFINWLYPSTKRFSFFFLRSIMYGIQS